jgi:hypothetical protein
MRVPSDEELIIGGVGLGEGVLLRWSRSDAIMLRREDFARSPEWFWLGAIFVDDHCCPSTICVTDAARPTTIRCGVRLTRAKPSSLAPVLSARRLRTVLDPLGCLSTPAADNAPDKANVALLMIGVIKDFQLPDGDKLLDHALPMARRHVELKRRAKAARIPLSLRQRERSVQRKTFTKSRSLIYAASFLHHAT